MADFALGNIVATHAVAAAKKDNDQFAYEVLKSLGRHADGDWGDLCNDDKALNDEALAGAARLFSAYETSKGRIWIITEWDRSVTTILFPDEY